MPDKIDYQAYNDHDLLVMCVMQGNDTVKQQERIISEFKELNGTVRSDHTWIKALRWGFGFIVLLTIGSITTGVLGVW